MKIIIKATEFELTPSLTTYIETKLSGLAKFIQALDTKGQPELRVEVGRTTRHHQHGPVFRAEGNLRLPGTVLRAEHVDNDARTAIARLRDKLHLEIEKHKTKHTRRPRGME